MSRELVVLLDDREVGRIRADRHGRLSLVYDEGWRGDPGAYPLSLSMPLARSEHPHKVVETFLWGLLPDNAAILERWARTFRTSARNPFALIASVGEDCAGAAQFVRPERLEVLRTSRVSRVEWLDTADIAARLRMLRTDQAAWRAPNDTGQFSLGGAQAKTALFHRGGRWGVPAGRVPTTHILKPPIRELEGHVENEHFCLELARSLGLPAVDSRVMHFDDEVAIVVTRYDRVPTHRRVVRVHQEDVCQALGVSPVAKYESEGGPGIRDVVGLLRLHSSARDEDVTTFMDAMAFNWLIAGTDAHAKNFALLLAADGRVRLAPLYDLASALPYPRLAAQKLKLAMRIGGEYRLRAIGPRQWTKAAVDAGLPGDAIRARVLWMLKAFPDSVADVRRQIQRSRLRHPVLDRLTDLLEKRGAVCRRLFAHERAGGA